MLVGPASAWVFWRCWSKIGGKPPPNKPLTWEYLGEYLLVEAGMQVVPENKSKTYKNIVKQQPACHFQHTLLWPLTHRQLIYTNKKLM